MKLFYIFIVTSVFIFSGKLSRAAEFLDHSKISEIKIANNTNLSISISQSGLSQTMGESLRPVGPIGPGDYQAIRFSSNNNLDLLNVGLHSGKIVNVNLGAHKVRVSFDINF